MKLNKENFDAIIIGSGIGGLVTASQLVAKGAQVLVLEKYIIPGGSGGSFINFLATSPAFTGNHLANPKQDNGDLKKTLKR